MQEALSNLSLPSAKELVSALEKEGAFVLQNGLVFKETKVVENNEIIFELWEENERIAFYRFKMLKNSGELHFAKKETIESKRNKGYSTLLQMLVIKVLKERMYRKLTGLIEIDNLASFKELRKRTDGATGKPFKLIFKHGDFKIAKEILAQGYLPEQNGQEYIAVTTDLGETVESNEALNDYILFLENYLSHN